MKIRDRLAAVEWDRVAAGLEAQGWATTGPLLTSDERDALVESYDDDGLFRSTITMARGQSAAQLLWKLPERSIRS